MRGLPPAPPDTIEYRQGYRVNGSHCSVVLWFFVPGLFAASFSEFDSLVGQLRNQVLLLVGNLSSSDCEDSDLTVLTSAPSPMSIRASSTGFVGSRGASSPLNASTGIYWSANDRGKAGHAITHVPGFPLSFTDDDVYLNGGAVDAVRLAAASFLVALESVSAGTLTSCRLIVVHRARHNAPLPAAEFSFIDHGIASPRIAGIQRRLRRSR